MRALALMFLGVVVGWTASGVDWSREAIGQDASTDLTEPSPLDTVPDRASSALEQKSPTDRSGPRWIYEESRSFDTEGNSITVPTRRDANDPLKRRTIIPRATRRVLAASEPNLVGRFQATAYGSPNGHGCYVVDTMTGQTWHILNGQPPQVVAAGLTPYAPQPAIPAHQPAYGPPSQLYPQDEGPVSQPELAEPTPDAAN